MNQWTLADLRKFWNSNHCSIRIYQDKLYFDGILHTHSKLDPIDRSARMIAHYVCADGYVVVVEKLPGINLETLPEFLSNNLIEQFYRDLAALEPTDRDASPSKYVQDPVTGRIRCVDLSELWVADSPF